MLISVVTPSFNQPDWLRLCLASVADQREVAVEHIVQDNLSGPEVESAARGFPGVRLFRERDEGMYDAVNRGLRRARGELCAYLNCDEQYLPGTLRTAAAAFEADPALDILFGDVVVIAPDGRYLCSRQVLPPLRWHSRVCFLNTFTAAMFFRHRLLDGPDGLFFDGRLRDLGDADWVQRALDRGLRMRTARAYLAAFVETGANRNLAPAARREKQAFRESAPAWMRLGAPLWSLHHRIRRLAAGHYRVAPFAYEIYPPGRPTAEARVRFEVEKGRFFWTSRMSGRKDR